MSSLLTSLRSLRPATWLLWLALAAMLVAFHIRPRGTLGDVALVLQTATAVLFTVDDRDGAEEKQQQQNQKHEAKVDEGRDEHEMVLPLCV